ncbi:MAG: bifunctional diaminohydroxyphosphoribosylaminopyrimidine deaminase/5-amino-6-(5-phosphoribosylamino)uracil reductase RibD [Idiomarina sp.]|nr:bifunctional diaminohydroxyphosphoribosylaminopyrimidine deaminase/5-amino-6-(5-phosphoribosylamino)uracil reductase RibD [Idiomarina sp.]
MISDGSCFSDFDKACMAEALRLAAKGIFTTSPNPNVGCVIATTKDTAHADTSSSPSNVNAQQMTIIGRGFHLKAGTAHAEVHALNQAGGAAKGATAYVTLEPCSHYGRTPPCADALIKAQVARVVVAMQDPYHEVAGRGLQKLRDAGIEVQVGLFGAQAAALNRGFIKRATQGLPYVRLKIAGSLDGRTALANGQSKWITGEKARHDGQFGRAISSAIMTGIGTVLADDPLLNVRLTAEDYAQGATLQRALANETLYAELAPWLAGDDADISHVGIDTIRQPVRVVVDNRCEVHGQLHLWSEPSPVWLASPQQCEQVALDDLAADGERLWITTGADSARVDLKELMSTLAERGINDLWVEAGANLAGALLQLGLVDEMIVYMAPKLMGPDAAALVDLPILSAMDQVPSFAFQSVETVGNDIKIVVRMP